jgi:hypothetical protein
VLSEFALDEINLDGIGKLLSFTPNDEVNALATIRYGELFGRSQVFQLAPNNKAGKRQNDVSTNLMGRTLFNEDLNFDRFTELYKKGQVIKSTPLTEAFTFQHFKKTYEDDFDPLFIISKEGSIQPFVVDNPTSPQPGDAIISLAKPETDKSKRTPQPTKEQTTDQ